MKTFNTLSLLVLLSMPVGGADSLTPDQQAVVDALRASEKQQLFRDYQYRLRQRRATALAIRRQRNVGRSYNVRIREPVNLAMHPQVYVHPLQPTYSRSRRYYRRPNCQPRRSDMLAHYYAH